MKKILSVLVLLSLTISFLAADDSFLYMDGKAVVGKEGELPKGLFAKAAGYLPGDIVSVTNPMNGETLDLLNLGAPDPALSSIILISKEAAKDLGISGEGIMQIKLSSRRGSFDESASGVGILSGSFSYSVAEKEEPSSKKSIEASEEPVAVEPSANKEDLLSESSLSESSLSEALPLKEVASAPDEDAVSEVQAAIISEEPEEEKAELAANAFNSREPIADNGMEDVVALEPSEENVEFFDAHDSGGELIAVLEPNAINEELVPEKVEAPKTVTASDDFFGEEIAVQEPEQIEYALVAESVPSLTTETLVEKGLPLEVAKAEEKAEEKKIVQEDIEETVAIIIPTNPNGAPETDFAGEEVVAVEPGEKSEEEIAHVEPEAKLNLSPVVPEEDKPAESVKPEERVTDENRIVESDNAAESVIALEPEEEIAQVKEEPEKEETKKEEPLKIEVRESEDEEYTPITLVPTENQVPPSSPKQEEKAEKEPEVKKTVSEAEPSIASEMSLEKGKYYVQIATVTDYSSAASFVEKYSKYPIVIVRNPSGTYKILAGPLSVDEYGVVLERFKSYGYKDAFVKRPR